jgi:hypothetical protein
MPGSEESRQHFEWVLREAEARRGELHKQIADLQRQLREIETTIAGVHRLAPPSVHNSFVQLTNAKPQRPPIPDSQKYADLSTRWAILIALDEVQGPLSIPELAEQLQAGGIRTEAANFNNNVSSVLTRMKSNRAEVDMVDGKWLITDIGRSAIAYIKAQKLRRRISRKTETPDAGTPGASSRKGDSV